MEIQGLYAAVYVSNMTTSTDFYTKLLGRKPDDKPMDTLVQWRGFGNAGIQLFHDPEKAGKGIMTLVTPDLEATRHTLSDSGIDIDPIRSGDFGKISHAVDPDGNSVTLAEPPKR